VENLEILALRKFGRFNVEELERIIKRYSCIDELLHSDENNGKATRFKKTFNPAFLEEQDKRLQKCGGGIITYWDETYPPFLKETHDPPPVLTYLGNPDLLKKKCVAVVGTRKATTYGLSMTEKIVDELIKMGMVVVSGMAFGIDSQAHKTALNGGYTIAVLGTGVDVCYPASNSHLYREIIKKGCIVSEFPFGTSAQKQNFPARNRIIAGLASSTIVVEAPLKSGALITSTIAAEIGRDVLALPGDVNRRSSEGCNMLISCGAHPIVSIPLLWTMFGLRSPQNAKVEDPMLNLFSNGPLSIDEIAELTNSQIEDILSKLTELEIKGKIALLPDGRYNKI